MGWLARSFGAVWNAMIAAAPVKVWAPILGAMALTVVLVGFGLVIWLGPWLSEHQGEQIEWLGRGMFLAGVLCMVTLVSITGVGLNFKASKDGVDLDLDADGKAPPLVVTTTTETTVEQPTAATPAADPPASKPPWERQP